MVVPQLPWLASPPPGWRRVRVKDTIQDCRNGVWGDEPDGVHDVRCVRVADFDRTSRTVRTAPTVRSVPPAKRNGRTLTAGDLLIEKSGGGDLQSVGTVVLYESASNHLPVVCSNFIARMRPATGFAPSFLRYLHAMLYAYGAAERAINQTIGIQNLDSAEYLATWVAVPPLDEQRRIAGFLDRKTASIDARIEKQHSMLAALADQRCAFVDRAVTEGVYGVRRTFRAGILGSLPVDWKATRVKNVVSLTTSGSRGWAEFYADDGALFLQSGNLDRRLGLDLSSVQHVRPPASSEGRRTRVKQDDILVCITGALTGNVSHVDRDLGEAYVNQHIALIRPDAERIEPQFLAYVLSSRIGADQFAVSQYGGTKQGLGLQDVRDVVMPLPPAHEQVEIVLFLSRRLRDHDSLTDILRVEIDKLLEYRQSLITAAVTGQLAIP
ncbi:MAG: restriction endonuclease subunit S [Deltaproteobacteria bacterium]|nr:restriction endonuclease subunit S [Deltaproteobacteria bacterium]